MVDHIELDGQQECVTIYLPANLPEDRMVTFWYNGGEVMVRAPDEAVPGQLIYVTFSPSVDYAEQADDLRRRLAEAMIDDVMERVEASLAPFDRLPPPRSDQRRAAIRRIQCDSESAHAEAVDLWPQLDDAQLDIAQCAYGLVQGRLPSLSRLERRAALTTAELVIPTIIMRRWN